MKNVKPIFKYFLCVVGCAYFGLLCSVISATPVRFFTHDYKTQGVVTGIVCVFSSMVLAGIMAYRFGYGDRKSDHENRPLTLRHLSGEAALMAFACILWVLISTLLRYRTAAATHVCEFVRAILDLSGSTDLTTLASEHGGAMFVGLLLTTLAYVPAMLGGYVVGHKRKSAETAKAQASRNP